MYLDHHSENYSNLEKQKSMLENKLALLVRESVTKVSKLKSHSRLIELLKHYKIDNLLKQLEGLSLNFNFQVHLFL